MTQDATKQAERPHQTAPAADLSGTRPPLLMWELLRAFIWMDRGLQKNMEARGWPRLSRTESQVMLLVSVGIVRPIEISRNLDITRQAINQTLAQLVEKKLVRLDADPCDKRCKIVKFANEGEAMRRDALAILQGLERELKRRNGGKGMSCFTNVENWDWDVPPIV